MSEPSSTRPKTLRQIFAVPLLLAIVSGVGLVAALLEDGVQDYFWSAAVGLPLAAIAWHVWRSWRSHVGDNGDTIGDGDSTE
ncbi:hypothetical protein DLM45_00590 [Hyphomicrobium methylovorum]|uniref:hypothetical protein n=1 Tax=Hyphomicrobium methylovorum TaxID=84 RepID=UPI0015E79253|nr:hypothetical protein [Hyphomicrobium methylovorum]MBA2124726.1 hypothetical protein [Hyphomicrobium methylovorum]